LKPHERGQNGGTLNRQEALEARNRAVVQAMLLKEGKTL
jgi:hypothetical protein